VENQANAPNPHSSAVLPLVSSRHRHAFKDLERPERMPCPHATVSVLQDVPEDSRRNGGGSKPNHGLRTLPPKRLSAPRALQAPGRPWNFTRHSQGASTTHHSQQLENRPGVLLQKPTSSAGVHSHGPLPCAGPGPDGDTKNRTLIGNPAKFSNTGALQSNTDASASQRTHKSHTPETSKSNHMQHYETIPWQHAVYTRKGPRDSYSFSHSSTTSVRKSFPPSLSIPCLCQSREIQRRNLEELRSATVLILVTGEWAIHVSVEAFLDNNYSIDRLPLERYNHLDRLGNVDSAECDELTKAYRALKYHCTMASYEAGETHAWRLQSVVPMLSDIVILPRLLEEKRLKTIMSSFCRATRKALRDSLILAGDGRIREEVCFQSKLSTK
jgi:hypothetical protein